MCVCIREERDREYSYSLVETGEAVSLLDKEIFNWVGARLSQAKYLVLAPPCPVCDSSHYTKWKECLLAKLALRT